jgi:hypothetical protein
MVITVVEVSVIVERLGEMGPLVTEGLVPNDTDVEG